MLAVVGVVLVAIAGILKLVSKYPDAIIWLIIIGVILIGAEVAWGWNRGGRYGRGVA
jgi:hypothetical protein